MSKLIAHYFSFLPADVLAAPRSWPLLSTHWQLPSSSVRVLSVLPPAGLAVSGSTLLTFQVPEGGKHFLACQVSPDVTLLAHSAFLEVSPSVPYSLFIVFLHRLLTVSWALALAYVAVSCIHIK